MNQRRTPPQFVAVRSEAQVSARNVLPRCTRGAPSAPSRDGTIEATAKVVASRSRSSDRELAGRSAAGVIAPFPPHFAGRVQRLVCESNRRNACATGLAGVDERFRVRDDLRACGWGEQHLHNRFGERVGAFAEAGDREVDVVGRMA